MRKPIIAGNWKMNMSVAQAQDYIAAIKDDITGNSVEAVICAPFTLLREVKSATAGTDIRVGAQNMHFEDCGAYTGEISPEMLMEAGVEYVIIGHSERRQFFNETDEAVNKKVLKGLSLGLKPIVCCGESLEQREAGETQAIVENQISKGLMEVKAVDIEKVVIAYEPIWAIGTGMTATSIQANEVIQCIREVVAGLFDTMVAQAVRIQYGGSVTPDTIGELMEQSDIDGALVGGASLKADSFSALVNF